jgi:fumarate hydratase class I
MREEPYEVDIISRYRPGAIMGKGGMGRKTLQALMEHGCVYLHTTGGAAQYLAERIVRVEAVYHEEFGQPESMWVLSVQDMPALVTMDSHGRSLHDRVREQSLERLSALFGLRLPGDQHP